VGETRSAGNLIGVLISVTTIPAAARNAIERRRVLK